MKNYDGLLNKKEKKRKNILVVRLWPMKRKQLGLLRVIDISKKKKKKKKKKERKKRKEKKKEKKGKKYIGCSALANEKKAAWVASCDRYFLNREIKRLLFGLCYEVFLIFMDIKICWYLDTCWIDCGYNSYHYCMVIGWLI